MPVIRTPDERFAGLPGYSYQPHYAEVNGLRMHYVDEGQVKVDRHQQRRGQWMST